MFSFAFDKLRGFLGLSDNQPSIPADTIFYHYTSTHSAEGIRRSRKIFSNIYGGVLLTTMKPENYTREEILKNNYGSSYHSNNKADYCVAIPYAKLSPSKLRKLETTEPRDIYLYSGDIHIEYNQVFDKPTCSRRKNFNQSAAFAHYNQQDSSRHNGSIERRCIIKCNVRRDQRIGTDQNIKFIDDQVVIAAPEWVKIGLNMIADKLPKGTVLVLLDDFGAKIAPIPIPEQPSLLILEMMARNEAYNTNGNIKFENYDPGIDQSLVYAIKDLVRQCVIVGSDWTTHYGGYPRDCRRTPQEERVFVCDLIGLQFQNMYNSGRLVVVGDNIPKGLLDDFIYEKVVQEKKPAYQDAQNDRSGRYIAHNNVYFDTKAYIKFVANDVLISGLALDNCATSEVNFKFLKYGTGYFAGPFRSILEDHISEGVAQGLELLLPRQTNIKSVELPFYSPNERIFDICRENKIEVHFSNEDALRRTHERYMTATTNCADPHTSTGNRMGFGSIDSAIAENLEGKGNKFSPAINMGMRELFIS